MDVLVLVVLWTFLLRDGMSVFMELLISRENMNWTLAEEYCEEWNGRLIVLDSQEKWDYFTSHDKYQENHLDEGTYWIGMRFNDSFKCDNTKRFDPWVYSGWGRWKNKKNEPNMCPSQQCVKVEFNLMRTTLCRTLFQVICEREMVHKTTVHDEITASSTELVEDIFVTSSITFTEPENRAASPTLVTTSSTPEVDITRSTVPSTISTTADVVHSNVINDTCRKCCSSSRELNSRKFEKYELEQSIIILRTQLAVNKTELSSQRRKLISVYDSRPSSVAMGGVAGAILVTVIGVIVVPDFLNLCRFVWKRLHTQRTTLIV